MVHYEDLHRASYLSAVRDPAAAGRRLQLLLLLEQEALVDAGLPAHLRLQHGRRALRLRTSELLRRHGQGRLLVELQVVFGSRTALDYSISPHLELRRESRKTIRLSFGYIKYISRNILSHVIYTQL